MELNAVILARENSSRCPHKNWRPFCEGKSLVDICVGRAILHFPPDRIFLSIDNPERAADAERLGVRSILRPPALRGSGDYPITKLIYSVTGELPDQKPIAWMAVTDPLFAQHEDLLLKWSRLRDGRADSIGVAYPAPHFLLNQDQQPVNWGYGSRMASSQAMQPWYWTSFVMQICEWRVARETRHYKGRNHHWFIAHGPAIDIDTEDDFRLAQLLYRHQSELPHGKQPDRYHQSHYV